ncbi:CidA/LrgA family protein [Vallitalea pronyensis]|uniref:CidA/LrgA family protein n=1 Tax=Vallitalea pronyensis TaxID=1348613 RepID=A0A8J8MIH9_9FIRM|nr:CidA/LrgA family protein [Vallitalea pronyensis]QUI22280.1 CidA/LrgA family protein [Vallitalea pronyensis]
MNVLIQFSFIIILLKIGQVIQYYINPLINIPEAILALVILFLLLQFKKVRMSQMKEISDILLDNMALFFVPLGVRIMTQMELLSSNITAILAIVILSTIITFITTSLVAKLMMALHQQAKERRSLHERNTNA